VTTFPTPSAATIERGFPDTATIQQRSVTRDDEGGEVETWSTRHADIPCQLSEFGQISESEQVASTSITTARELQAMLLGRFDDIVESDQVLVRGLIFDISGIVRDSWPIVTTLRVKERNP
jgi:head-tail adaptor